MAGFIYSGDEVVEVQNLPKEVNTKIVKEVVKPTTAKPIKQNQPVTQTAPKKVTN